MSCAGGLLSMRSNFGQ
ncbi:TPA: hypothetical protein ANIA_11464 [Aspergillus nidulans FGSC A4]|uniref:Uncharacterized protein n=1 Tax=Emericella nidulans (strain FGSC A4 / ATCC 38163 / CBS 112.46 / NRRL 194 / M139) TaxID=227321 RepID=C8VEW1_EMENI|nr:TPA: hypothetical protein ANIA_11464 [Aspergillus nidulans FGSC A4]